MTLVITNGNEIQFPDYMTHDEIIGILRHKLPFDPDMVFVQEACKNDCISGNIALALIVSYLVGFSIVWLMKKRKRKNAHR